MAVIRRSSAVIVLSSTSARPTSPARPTWCGAEMCMPGDNVKVTVELHKPIAMDDGVRFAIREGGRTVGSGVVTKIVRISSSWRGASLPGMRRIQGCSSIGRAPVSKTGGCEFDSRRPCHSIRRAGGSARASGSSGLPARCLKTSRERMVVSTVKDKPLQGRKGSGIMNANSFVRSLFQVSLYKRNQGRITRKSRLPRSLSRLASAHGE